MENAIKDNSYKIVKPGKRLLSALADFFLLFVLASGLYSVAVYPIMKLLPSYKTTLKEQENYVLREIHDETHALGHQENGCKGTLSRILLADHLS